MAIRLFQLLLLLTSMVLAGCADTGGDVGDANDPEASGADMEQMEEETGEGL